MARQSIIRLSSFMGLILGFCLVSTTPVLAQQGGHGAIPDNATERRFGGGWECNLGYRSDGESCAEIILPENAYPTGRSYGTGWECTHGYAEKSG